MARQPTDTKRSGGPIKPSVGGSQAAHSGAKGNAPNDLLKKSIAACSRAISGDKELEVVYASDRAGHSGQRLRLPDPPRKMTAEDVAVTRGHGDAMAMRLAAHDAETHRRLSPDGVAARAIFDAVEFARCCLLYTSPSPRDA